MRTLCVTRRCSVLVLVITMSVMGMPRPASAAGDELPAGAHDRGLTINGQPLSQVLRGPARTPSSP